MIDWSEEINGIPVTVIKIEKDSAMFVTLPEWIGDLDQTELDNITAMFKRKFARTAFEDIPVFVATAGTKIEFAVPSQEQTGNPSGDSV